MRDVAVIGIGQTKVAEHWDKSLRELAGDAALAALKEAQVNQIDSIYVGNMMSGVANLQGQLGTMVADWIGQRFTDAVKIESACSSGGAAFRMAMLSVASGEADIAMAVGVEKMTDSPSNEITSALATAADADWEVDHGLSFVALNALLMKRYMHEYGWEGVDFAEFAINAHANAVHNPFARFRKAIDQQRFITSPMICDPINLMDASPIGDGAAAAILAPAEMLTAGAPKILVVGSAAATDTIAVHDRKQPLWLAAAEKSSREAYEQAGIGSVDIDLFEYHDAFTIMAALSLEASGFAEPGKGPVLAKEGDIKINGRIPVATRGGLKARGHPVGATGMYQLVEVVQQLRGQAGETQVPNPEFGMAQNIGGSGSNIVTHILRRAS
ncbi:MAG: thiolase domain-containing protein [Chloroflexota bacterium]|nr:thiolase domain-containing protein [Chloroflexota bacterium]